MAHDGAIRPEVAIPGWCVWQSDTRHWWATRERPLSDAENASEVYRTVDADTGEALHEAVAEQERRAAALAGDR